MLDIRGTDFIGVLKNEPEDRSYRVNIIIVEGLPKKLRYAWADWRDGDGENAKSATPSEQNTLKPSKISTSATSTSHDPSIERLVRDIPEGRVFTFGFNAYHLSSTTVDLAGKIKGQIWNEDPIVFVAQNLGEIAVKKAIGGFNSCAHRTKAVIFLDTPNQQMENKELVLKKDPHRYSVARNVETDFEQYSRGYQSAVEKWDIRIYSFQEADGISGNVLRREINSVSSVPDFSNSIENVGSIDINQTRMESSSGSAEAEYQAVLGVILDSISHQGETGEAASQKDVPSLVAAETQGSPVLAGKAVAPMITAKTLCQVCSNIHFRRLWDCGFTASEIKHYLDHTWGFGLEGVGLFYYIHHKSKEALEASAENGCHFCIMLWRALCDRNVESSQPWRAITPRSPGEVLLSLEGPKMVEVRSQGSSFMRVKCGDRVFEGQIGPTYEDAVKTKWQTWPMVFHDSTKTSAFFSDLDKTTTSPANVTLASTWLENCIDHHRMCDMPSENPALPRRVVDVSHPDAIRLEDSNGIRGQYVALSYKWGGIVKSVTTSENYPQRIDLFPQKDLPKTFRDAIDFTRGLGIRYLWIDALCIIQDSREELETEIASMDRVYQNATLTIFAAGAEDVDSGFSVARNPLETRACQLDVKFTNHGQTISMTTNVSFYEAHIPLGPRPLFDRGWVLQEQILSRRGLIFGTRFVSWECLCIRSSEKWPTVTIAETTNANTSFNNTISKMRRAVYQHQKDRSKSENLACWYDMVQDYALRALTNPTDVLRALAGLANAIGRVHQVSYASGLWMEDLQAGLSWFVQKSNNAQDVPHKRSEGLAEIHTGPPSWTWASRWGFEIGFRGDMGYSKLLECEGIEVEDDCEDTARRETLMIKGCLKVGLARWLPEGGHIEDRHLQDPLWVGSVRDAESGKGVGTIAYDGEPENTEDLAITCLLCSIGKYYAFSDDWHVSCLALVPSSKSKGSYRRVGIIFLADEHWFGYEYRGNGYSTSLPRIGTIEHTSIKLV